MSLKFMTMNTINGEFVIQDNESTEKIPESSQEWIITHKGMTTNGKPTYTIVSKFQDGSLYYDEANNVLKADKTQQANQRWILEGYNLRPTQKIVIRILKKRDMVIMAQEETDQLTCGKLDDDNYNQQWFINHAGDC